MVGVSVVALTRTRRRRWSVVAATVCAGAISVGSAAASFAAEPGETRMVTNWGTSTSYPMQITNGDGSTFVGTSGMVLDGSNVVANPKNPNDPFAPYNASKGVNPADFTGYNVEPQLSEPGNVKFTAYDPLKKIPQGANQEEWIKNQNRIAAVLQNSWPIKPIDASAPPVGVRRGNEMRAMVMGTQMMLWKLAGHKIDNPSNVIVLNAQRTGQTTDEFLVAMQPSRILHFYKEMESVANGVDDFNPAQGKSPIVFWRPDANTHGAVTLGAPQALPQAKPAAQQPLREPVKDQPALVPAEEPAPTPSVEATPTREPSAPASVTPVLPHTGVDDGLLRGLAWWSAAITLLGVGLLGRSRELAAARSQG